MRSHNHFFGERRSKTYSKKNSTHIRWGRIEPIPALSVHLCNYYASLERPDVGRDAREPVDAVDHAVALDALRADPDNRGDCKEGGGEVAWVGRIRVPTHG